MARMLPDQVSEHTSSNAERRLFGKLRDGLSDDWTVLHSLGMAVHTRKPWAEIDFVLVGPPGVICIEVKGGRVRRRGGVWQLVDAGGRITEKREGPFEQVGSASAALYNWLRDHVEAVRSSFVGFAVAAPDARWEVEGPDIIVELVYDADDAVHPVDRFVDRIVGHWRRSMEERFGLAPQPLDNRTRTAVIDALRGDFDLRPSLRARVRNVADDLVRLTHEQHRVLDGLADSPRAIIRGGAGTGKTLLGVEEALRAIRSGKRVALLCSSRNLGDNLRRAVADERSTVGHLHGIMGDIVSRSGRTRNLPDASPMDLFTLFYPEQALEGLADLDELGSIDILIVDEAQDLLQDGYLDVFDGLLDGGLGHGSWRMFVDPVQNIFDVMHTPALQRVTAHRPAEYRLTVNCRNTREIAVHTSLLADVDLVPVLQVEGDAVEIIWYSDPADLGRKVVRHLNRLLSGGIDPRDITLLGPRRLEDSTIAGRLDGVPYPVTALGPGDRVERTIQYSTIAGFKGLESNVVVVLDVEDLPARHTRGQVYVATSRARALLAVFIADSARDGYEELVRRLGDRLRTNDGDYPFAKQGVRDG